MNRNNNSIITEDGQRLTVNEGLITGTEDPGPGLAYSTGNVLDEKNHPNKEEEKNLSPTPADENADQGSKK